MNKRKAIAAETLTSHKPKGISDPDIIFTINPNYEGKTEKHWVHNM